MPKRKKRKQKKNKERQVPERTCIACRRKAPKKEMIRFVLGTEGKPSMDLSGKKRGRGANLCASLECFDQALEKNSFGRSWRTKIDTGELKDLRQEVDEYLSSAKSGSLEKEREKVTVRVKKEVVEKKLGKSKTQPKQ